jgi:hypothetical protein
MGETDEPFGPLHLTNGERAWVFGSRRALSAAGIKPMEDLRREAQFGVRGDLSGLQGGLTFLDNNES